MSVGYARGWTLENSLSMMDLPLSPRNTHKQLHVLDRNPTGENLHCILKVGFEDDVPHAID